MNDAPLGLLFGSLIILITLSAFFSSSETGMMSLNRYRLRHLKNQGNTGARRASRLLDMPDRLITLILVGNNLVNFTASAIVTVIGFRLAGDAGIALATLIFTLAILIFAEITPKTIAAVAPERIAFPASSILQGLMRAMKPVVVGINALTNGLVQILGIDLKKDNEQLSSDELRTIVDEAGAHIPDRHQAMLLNILDLEQMRVDDIMIQDHDIFSIDVQEEDAKIVKKLLSCDFARIPIVDGQLDKMLGILLLRDVHKALRAPGDSPLDRNVMMSLLREPYYIPEHTPLNTQLFNFQKNKRRQGIVVDEYGQIIGLVTLEDILEEIVGEFTSNLNDSEEEIVLDADNSYIINGTAQVREINRSLSWNLPVDGPRTLSGLLVEKLETLPEASVGVQIGQYIFEVLKIDDNIIQTVRCKTLHADSN